MAYDEIKQDIIDDGDGGDEGGSGTTSLIPDAFAIPDSADPAELSRIAENSITEGHAEKVAAKIGQRQPDAAQDNSGPGITFEEQPKLADQHDGVAPNISSDPANNAHAMRDFEKRVENSEVSEELIYQNAEKLNPEKRAELLNKATNKKNFNPQLTR
jgi:hypothetical protein